MALGRSSACASIWEATINSALGVAIGNLERARRPTRITRRSERVAEGRMISSARREQTRLALTRRNRNAGVAAEMMKRK